MIRRLFLPGLVLLTCAVYAQTASFDFIHRDDPVFIVTNPYVQEGLSWKSIRWAFEADLAYPSGDIDYWQPVTILSRLLDVELHGLDPSGHHWTNVILHAANVILFFMLLRRLTNRPLPSAFAAAMFAVHPMHAASVAWVTERKDVLSLFFGLIALSSWIDFVRTRQKSCYAIAFVSFVLSLMSKPLMIPLPVLMLLVLVWPAGLIPDPGRFRNWLNPALRILPFCALSTASFFITLRSQPSELHSVDPMARLANIIVAPATYLGRLFAPFSLSCYYPFPDRIHSGAIVLASILLLLAITAAAIMLARSKPCIFTGWFWFIGAIMPATIATTREATANRFTYLPYLGLYMMISWLAADLAASWRIRKGIVTGAAGSALLLLAILGHAETAHWKNSFTLFEQALIVNPDNYFAHQNLGVAFFNIEDYARARLEFQEALRIRPSFAPIINNLGRAETMSGNLREAEAHYREAIRLEPDFLTAYRNLEELLLMSGRDTEAEKVHGEILRTKGRAATADE